MTARVDAVLRVAGVAVALSVAAGCARQLPAQDRRIREAVAIAKMSTADLWQDFAADAASARARYRGQPIEVSGTPTQSDGQDEGGAYLLFVESGAFGVRANLLDDDAPAILEAAKAGGRLTLKCFCDGIDGHVVLRSCVRP